MSPVWPTPLEEKLLLACFGYGAEGEERRRLTCEEWALIETDAGAARQLPLVCRLWPEANSKMGECSQRAYLSTWGRNRFSMGEMPAIAARLRQQKIGWMALKGAALVLRHYKDAGLRQMTDIDVLIRREDLPSAIAILMDAGYEAEGQASAKSILRQSRVRHAWQFLGANGLNFDLHWQPVVRCYAPQVAESFREHAEAVPFGDVDVLVPSPTEQLFHVCVHGLQWDWDRKTRWVADALMVLREPLDWVRLHRLAEWAGMSYRLSTALDYLREHFGAPVPADTSARLRESAPGWEQCESELLLKPCPLGLRDSAAWHLFNFRRIRVFDEDWQRQPAISGFPEYIAAFLDASGPKSLVRNLWPYLKSRAKTSN
jgi:hypothetical protein